LSRSSCIIFRAGLIICTGTAKDEWLDHAPTTRMSIKMEYLSEQVAQKNEGNRLLSAETLIGIVVIQEAALLSDSRIVPCGVVWLLRQARCSYLCFSADSISVRRPIFELPLASAMVGMRAKGWVAQNTRRWRRELTSNFQSYGIVLSFTSVLMCWKEILRKTVVCDCENCSGSRMT
jgi:hypothetical protein